MKRLTVLFVLIVLVSGLSCGGGGGGTSTSVTPPETSLVGTYRLSGFALDVYDGSMNYIGRLTQEDFSSWSGTMKMGTDTISQQVTLEGYTVAPSGTYSVTYTNGTIEGILHCVDQTGSYDVNFTCAGNSLTTYTGVIYDPIWNEYFEEYDYWEKTSDALSFSSVATHTKFYSDSGNLMIGAIIGSIAE